MTVSERDGRVALRIDDDELRDMVDDHLTEVCDIQCEYLSRADDGPELTVMVFPRVISLDQLHAALDRLDPEEVERVFRINNPPESTD